MSVSAQLKTSHRSLDVVEVLSSPVEVLLGVSSTASKALAQIDVSTVFDLACSQVFSTAVAVVSAAEGKSDAARFGRLPSDVFDKPAPVIPDLVEADLEGLKALEPGVPTALKSAFGVATVRDLALWPPYVAACGLLNEVVGGVRAGDEADELIPRFGEYPTERSYFTSIVRQPGRGVPGPPLTSVSLSTPAVSTTPSTGALVTFSQSWYAPA